MRNDDIEKRSAISLRGDDMRGNDHYAAKPSGSALFDFFTVLVEWRRFLVWFVFLATATVTIYAFFQPKWFKATASVFPAEKSLSLFPGLEGASTLFRSLSGGGGLSSLTGPSEADRYVAILQSERVMWAVIEKFELTKVYEITKYPRERTLRELRRNTAFEITNEGNLNISVYDKVPARASEMANYFVEMLNKVNSELHAQNAQANLEFISQRYQRNLDDLRKSEEDLKSFQQKYGVIAMPEQVEATMKAGAELIAALTAKEVNLAVLSSTLSPDHPSTLEAKLEVDELRKKVREMSRGFADGATMSEARIFVPFRQMPELGIEYFRLAREVEIQNKILEFLTPIYEQAKVEEKRSTPSVVVLDYATIPERKAKPKVSLYALLALVSSTVIAMAVVFTCEMIERLRTIDQDRFDSTWNVLRSDWFGLRLRRRGTR